MDPRPFHKRGSDAAATFFHDFRMKMNSMKDALVSFTAARNLTIMTTMVAMWAQEAPAELTTDVFTRDMNAWMLAHRETFWQTGENHALKHPWSAIKLAGKFAETAAAFARLVYAIEVAPVAAPLAALVDKLQTMIRAQEKTASFNIAPLLRHVYGFGNEGVVRSNNSRARAQLEMLPHALAALIMENLAGVQSFSTPTFLPSLIAAVNACAPLQWAEPTIAADLDEWAAFAFPLGGAWGGSEDSGGGGGAGGASSASLSTPVKRPREVDPVAPRKKPAVAEAAEAEPVAEHDAADDEHEAEPVAEQEEDDADDADADAEGNAGPVHVQSIRIGEKVYGRVFRSFEDAQDFVQKFNVRTLMTIAEIFEKYEGRIDDVADGDYSLVYDIGSHQNFSKISILMQVFI